jgi:hypothetical protein
MEGYQWCFNHRPDLAETRRRNAQRAGQAGGRGRPGAGASAELVAVKRELRMGAVIGGLYNTLLRALEVQRKWHEADVLEARIEALEAEQEQEGGSRWHA